MNKSAILVIDDEAAIRKLLAITLESNGYAVTLADSSKTGQIMAANHPPSLIVLDLGLPDESGHQTLKALRGWYTNPIVVLSVKDSEEDIVTALDNGANDYLCKPFRTGELLARIRSALRLSQTGSDPLLLYGNLSIDLAGRVVTVAGSAVKLTATEYNLLALLVRNEGKVLTHHYLLKEVWGPGYISQSQYLRVFIAQLRKKIETDPNHPDYIITEQGIGYRFRAV